MESSERHTTSREVAKLKDFAFFHALSCCDMPSPFLGSQHLVLLPIRGSIDQSTGVITVSFLAIAIASRAVS